MKNNKLIMILIISTSLIISGNVFAKPSQTFSNVFTFGDSFSTPINGWAALITQHYGYKYVNNQTNFSLSGASTTSLDPELQAYKNTKTAPEQRIVFASAKSIWDEAIQRLLAA